MNKKIITISAIFFGMIVLLSAVRADTMTPQGALELIKQKLFGDKTAAPTDNAATAGWGAVDFGKMMMDNADDIKKVQQSAGQAQKFLTAGTGKMTPEIWVEITARLRCVDAAVVDEETANKIMSQFGITSAEYAAFAWQTFTAGQNFEIYNKRYEGKYNELIAAGNCGIATVTTTIQGMDDAKWTEITALLMCLTDTGDVEIKHGWIFSKHGTTINEFAEYGKKLKTRADYGEIKEKARARYWTLLGSQVCDKLNESVIASSGTLPFVPFVMDDQNLWDYLKLKVKNLGCKIGLEVGGMDCSPPVIVAEPTTTAAGEKATVRPEEKKESWLKKIKCKVKKFFGKKC